MIAFNQQILILCYQGIRECLVDHMNSVSDRFFVVLVFLLYNIGFDEECNFNFTFINDECTVKVHNVRFNSTAYKSILSELCRRYKSKTKNLLEQDGEQTNRQKNKKNNKQTKTHYNHYNAFQSQKCQKGLA